MMHRTSLFLVFAALLLGVPFFTQAVEAPPGEGAGCYCWKSYEEDDGWFAFAPDSPTVDTVSCNTYCDLLKDGAIGSYISPEVEVDRACDPGGETTCYCSGQGASGGDTVSACKSSCGGMAEGNPDIKTYQFACTIDGALTVLGSGNLDGSDIIEVEEVELYTPELSIDIPGLTLSPATSTGGEVTSNYIGEYIEAAYAWVIGAAALVAIIVLMVGGLQYMTSRGDSGKVGQAKQRMVGAITGLVLLLGAYTIAYIIDPGTTVFESLTIDVIDAVKYVNDSGEVAGSLVFNPPDDIDCDDSFEISEIVASMDGKVTYRLGGKGGGPPYSSETKTDPNGTSYASYCPAGQLCLDCSGFVDYVRTCKGLSSAGESGGSAGIFGSSSAEKITSCSSDAVNDKSLVAGDLIGFPTIETDEETQWGHVWIYAGDGNVADSHGSGRGEGQAVGRYTLSYVCSTFGSKYTMYAVRR